MSTYIIRTQNTSKKEHWRDILMIVFGQWKKHGCSFCRQRHAYQRGKRRKTHCMERQNRNASLEAENPWDRYL